MHTDDDVRVGNSWSGAGVSVPYWVKLVRSVNNFIAYVSADGNTWTEVGGTYIIPMAGTVYIGVAVTSENSSQVTTATFDNVSLLSNANTGPDFYLGTTPTVATTIAAGGSVGYPKVFVDPVNGFNGPVSLSVSGLPTGASASFSPAAITASGVSMLTITTTSSTPAGSYPLTITGVSGSLSHTASLTLTISSTSTTLPAGWTNQDIGTPGTGTGSSYSNGTYTVAGEGCCLWHYADTFQFAYQTLSGDGTIIARLASESNVVGSAKAGVMIRETLAPESVYAFMGVQSGNTPAMQSRSATFGAISSNTGTGIRLPYWVKLVRSVNNFTGYISANGSDWTQVSSTVAISMAGPVYIGFAVTSENNSQVTTANFDNLTISSIANESADFYLGTTCGSRKLQSFRDH